MGLMMALTIAVNSSKSEQSEVDGRVAYLNLSDTELWYVRQSYNDQEEWRTSNMWQKKRHDERN